MFCEIFDCSGVVIKMSNSKLMSRTEKSVIKFKWTVLLQMGTLVSSAEHSDMGGIDCKGGTLEFTYH